MKITARGWKARDVALEVPGRVLLLGPNGSGKSGITDGFRFAVVGHVPALGRELPGTLLRADAQDAGVAVELDAQRTFVRYLSRKPRGGFESSVSAIWLQEGASTDEHAAAVLHPFGTDREEVAESLDVRVLLRLSDNQRAARLERVIAAAASTETENAVGALLMARLIGVELETVAESWHTDAARKMVPKPQRAVIRAAWPVLVAKLREVSIAGALAWANGEKRTAMAAVRGKTAARDELNLKIEKLPVPDDAEIARLEAERSRLERELGANTRATEALATARRERRTAEADAAAARTALDAAQRTLEVAREDHAAAKTAATEIPALERELERLVEPTAAAPDVAELDDRAAREDAIAREIEIPAAPDTARRDALRAELESYKARLAAALDAANPLRQLRTVLEQRRRSAKAGTPLARLCDELIAIVLPHVPDDLEAAAAMRAAEDALAAEQARIGELETTRQRLTADVFEAQERARALRAEADRRRADARAAARIAHETYTARHRELTTKRDRLRDTLTRAEAAERAAAAALERAQAALTAADARVAALPPLDESDEPAALDLEARVAGIEHILADMRRAAGEREALAGIVAELEAAEAGRVVYAALEWALTEVRNRAISGTGGPLVETMARLFAAAEIPARPFVRAGRNVCDLGWTIDGKDVRVEALSGGEWVLFVTALTAAMLELRAPEFRVLLVEGAEVDAEKLTTLTQLIEAADVTHAIVCVPIILDDEPTVDAWRDSYPAWTVIDAARDLEWRPPRP